MLKLEPPKEVMEDLRDYRNKLNDYMAGNMEEFRFKPYRVQRGVYEQRGFDAYMIRTRLPGGEISLTQLRTITDLARKYASKVHFTTRQGIQLHDVKLGDTDDVIEGLLEAGILTKGSGGNTPRNVVSSPLSGVSQDDVFDVSTCAKAVTYHFMKDQSAFNLPRKYKIAFSNSEKDTANAVVADLGFIATNREGQNGFIVYGGGGLGNKPACGIKLADFAPSFEVLYYAEAMKRFFEAKGDRTNKNKARIRHIVQRESEREFIRLFQDELSRVKSELDLNIELSLKNEDNTSSGFSEPASYAQIIPQKQSGYYSVYIHPDNGNMSSEELEELIDIFENINHEFDIRISNNQGFYVRNIKYDSALKLLEDTSKFVSYGLVSYSDIDDSIACTGADTCKLGLCLSQNLLKYIKGKFNDPEQVSPEVRKQLPRLYISGCPNSCGQHQIGKLGLSGKAKRTKDGLIPMYVVHFKGRTGISSPSLATSFGELPAKKVPDFLVKLAELRLSKSGKSESTEEEAKYKKFESFVSENSQEIEKLIQEYSRIESYEENPGLYYDFGSKERFSIEGRSPGECSAGILEVINKDIENARNKLEEYQHQSEVKEKSDLLYEVGLSAARSLLVLRGIDTNKDREIFNYFVEHFVDEGYLKPETKDSTDSLLDYKLGDISDLQPYYEDISYMVDKVAKMYDSLDSKLEITLQKEQQTEKISFQLNKPGGSSVSSETEKSNYETIDLRGVKCPLNFAKVKVYLSNINSGEVMGFYLDNGEPIENVPQSAESEGHKVKEIKDYGNYSVLILEKS